jgi:hypothetical protein
MYLKFLSALSKIGFTSGRQRKVWNSSHSFSYWLQHKFYENQYYSCQDVIYRDLNDVNISTVKLFCEKVA